MQKLKAKGQSDRKRVETDEWTNGQMDIHKEAIALPLMLTWSPGQYKLFAKNL